MSRIEERRPVYSGFSKCIFCGRGEKILKDGSSICLYCNPKFKGE